MTENNPTTENTVVPPERKKSKVNPVIRSSTYNQDKPVSGVSANKYAPGDKLAPVHSKLGRRSDPNAMEDTLDEEGFLKMFDDIEEEKKQANPIQLNVQQQQSSSSVPFNRQRLDPLPKVQRRDPNNSVLQKNIKQTPINKPTTNRLDNSSWQEDKQKYRDELNMDDLRSKRNLNFVYLFGL